MDHHTHHLLLRQSLFAEQGRIRRAIADFTRCSLHGSRSSDLVRVGGATKRERAEQIPYARRRKREGGLEVLATLEKMKGESTVVLYTKRHGCIKLRSNEEMITMCTCSSLLMSATSHNPQASIYLVTRYDEMSLLVSGSPQHCASRDPSIVRSKP